LRIVIKFGGTSVGNGTRITKVCEMISKLKEKNQIIVVSSALQSTTDELVKLAESAKKGKMESEIFDIITQRHKNTVNEIIHDKKIQNELLESVSILLEELEKTINGIMTVNELSNKTLDKILSFGEKLAVPIISAKLRDSGIESKSFTGEEIGIMTDENFGNASPLVKVTQHNIKNNLAGLEETVPVITGFIGVTQQGETSTIGRGGSDYTASLIGMCLDVDEIWIMTDVDGLLTANPKIYPNAKIINCKRDILSSIVSIFQNNLTELAWAHDLDKIFRYFNNYFKIIEKYKKINPNFIYELEFEKLVNNPEEESKKLMKFCELPWDKKCLEFYKREDLFSKTASNIQIRKAIYKHSVTKYLPYKKFLNQYGEKYSWFN